MEFSLFHIELAALGGVLAATPVILHLILRQKPRHELFPALQLIRLRHRVNLRKLRIRHWLLLALRMLLIALLGLALARPSIHGASFISDQQAPVAAALVFDTSLSMEYRERDRTRLDDAQRIALELLQEFPDGSELLVLDAADPTARFFPEVTLARQRIESLRLRPRARSLNQAIVEACRALKASDRARKEIYVFSDLLTGSLSLDGASELRSAIQSVKGGVGIYLLNVGVPEPRNAFIAEVSSSAEVIPANSDLTVRVVVQDAGLAETAVLELVLDDQTRGTQEVALEKNHAARGEFFLPRLAPGVHQGRLVLRGGGGLAFDDVHYLTVEVRPATRVLVVSDLERDAQRLTSALAPPSLVEQQRAWYQCDWIPTARLPGKSLADFSVVCLVNVSELSLASWQALEKFVMSGGGLGIFLGDRVQPDNYNQEGAQAIVPLKLGEVYRPAQPVFLKAPVPGHAVVRKLHEWDPAALGAVLVQRYFRSELSSTRATRVIDFTDGSIALTERTLGGTHPGRVLVMTTPVSSNPRDPWNELPQSSTQFVILAHSMTSYLAGHSEQRLNFQVGDDVTLYPDRGQRFGVYLLSTPGSDQPARRSAGLTEGSVVVAAPEKLGNYRVASGQGEQAFEKGFSLNPDPAESRLDPLSASELSAIFGGADFAVARTTEELRRVMGDVRIGRELFPLLMPLILILFALEHWVANRFYKRDRTVEREAGSVKRQWQAAQPQRLSTAPSN